MGAGDKIVLAFSGDGMCTSVYQEQFDMSEIGKTVSITRASQVEPEVDGTWSVTFLATGEKVTGFKKRTEAIAYEVERLNSEMGRNSTLCCNDKEEVELNGHADTTDVVVQSDDGGGTSKQG